MCIYIIIHSIMSTFNKYITNFRSDFPAGLVVFLVALPLCLGIAMASGAPLFSGIIAGIVGGIIVGFISNSNVSVSGPAAGLTAIVLSGITSLGTFELFLMAVMCAGFIQLVLGFLKAGSISNYFPNNVIEGMLAGIGIIIILKQIPHAFGYDRDSEGDMAFIEKTGSNTLTSILDTFNYVHWGATLTTLISIIILVVWDKIPALKKLKILPGALVAVIVGIILNEIFVNTGSPLSLSSEHLVALPVLNSLSEIGSLFVFPDFNGLTRTDVWTIAGTIAIVASIETLLCIEAGDRLDRHKRYTNTNLELKAQGIGNVVSGFLGGLPMTSVVVRTTANINSGNETKLSTIIHGVLLLISVLAIPVLLNKIPLATLAGILILIGFKLANPKHFLHFYHQGKYQFIPFVCTVIAVVFTDLLKGVGIGLIISVIFVLKGNLKKAYQMKKERKNDNDVIQIDLAEEVSFLNKAAIKSVLSDMPANSKVIINASKTEYINHDVLELIREFSETRGPEKQINVHLIGFKPEYKIENTVFP